MSSAAVVAMLLAAVPGMATERWALLIGIADYQHLQDLEGPANDVASLKTVLVEQWGFDPAAMQTLVDGEATRTRILDELDLLHERSAPGDEVLIYFSGHGTSRFDPRQPWPLPHTSGALIPADFTGSGSIDEQTRELLIGRTDLRPALEKLDKGQRLTVVAIDACFSGNVVRAASASGLTPKYQPLEEDLATGSAPVAVPHTPFPYSRVFVIAAASEHEFAYEIGRAALADYPTIDGKTHGVFTNALLTVLSKAPPAGPVALGELAADIQRAIDSRAFPQRIRTLVASASAVTFYTHPLFGRQHATSTQLLERLATTAAKSELRVSMTLAGGADPQRLVEASEITVNVAANRNVFLVLLNIAPDGDVNLLYPDSRGALLPLSPARLFQVPDPATQMPVVIGPPFGNEQLVALAFTQIPPGYELLFLSKDHSSAIRRFLATLADNTKSSYALASLQLRTTKTNTVANDGARR